MWQSHSGLKNLKNKHDFFLREKTALQSGWKVLRYESRKSFTSHLSDIVLEQ